MGGSERVRRCFQPFGNVELEVLEGYPVGDVQHAVGQASLEFRHKELTEDLAGGREGKPKPYQTCCGGVSFDLRRPRVVQSRASS